MSNRVIISICTLLAVTPAFAFNGQEISQIINKKNPAILPPSLHAFDNGRQYKWESIHGPEKNSIFDILQVQGNANILFAYEFNMVYKSIDGGTHWQPLPIPTGVHIIDMLSLDANQLLLISKNQIYLSSDQGEHWSLLTILNVNCKKAFRLSASVLMMNTDSGMYRSLDNGKTWTPALLGLSSRVDHLTGRGKLLLANASDGVYISRDSGVLWTYLKTPFSVFSHDEPFAISSKNEIYFSSELKPTGLYKTDINAQQFDKINENVKFNDLKIDSNDYLYGLDRGYDTCQKKKGLYRSIDHGRTWEHIYKGDVYKFILLEDARIVIQKFGKGTGTFISDVSQKNYIPLPIYSINSDVEKVLATDDKHIFALNNFYKNNLYETKNAGHTWSRTFEGYVNDLAKFENQAVMLAYKDNVLTLYAYQNNEAWSAIKTFAQPKGTFCALSSHNGGLIVNCDHEDISWFTKDLTHWNTIDSANIKRIKRIYFDGINLYASCGYAEASINYSRDGGNTWTTLIEGLFYHPQAINGYQHQQDNILLLAFPYAGIIKTSDNGLHWELINNGLTNYNFRDLVVIGKDEYLAVTSDGVFHTLDGGRSWFTENTGLAGKSVTSLSITHDSLFAGTADEGIFKASSF